VIKSGGATRKYNHLEIKYITYFDVPKFGHINEFKDLKLQDISAIDLTVDLIANLGAVIIMVFKTAN